MSALPPIDILLMAAGGSSRIGRPKQLLPYKDSSLIRHLAVQAIGSNASTVRVVLGAERDIVRNELRDLDVVIVENKHWTRGLSTSITTGLEGVSPSAAGVILMLADMPHVTTSHLNTLIETHVETKKGIVASRYGKTSGVPTLFTRRHFQDLQNLRGDTGAKVVLMIRADDVTYVDLPGGDIDIDTEEDARTHLHRST